VFVLPLASAFQPTPLFRHHAVTASVAPPAISMQQGRDADDVAGAVGNTFGDIFSSFFKPSAEKQAEIDRAYAEQLEVAERRRNPDAYLRKIRQTERRRAQASKEASERIAWQRSANPLEQFLERQKKGKVKPLGYEDTPKGGIPLPSASFGVGGEFGVGGKYDNGERFDLRLPFVETGWVEERKRKKASEAKPKAGRRASAKVSGRRGGGQGKKETTPPPSNPIEWWIQKTR